MKNFESIETIDIHPYINGTYNKFDIKPLISEVDNFYKQNANDLKYYCCWLKNEKNGFQQCNYHSEKQHNVQTHITNTHFKINHFGCDYCDKFFTRIHSLDRHKRQIHNIDTTKVKPIKYKKKDNSPYHVYEIIAYNNDNNNNEPEMMIKIKQNNNNNNKEEIIIGNNPSCSCNSQHINDKMCQHYFFIICKYLNIKKGLNLHKKTKLSDAQVRMIQDKLHLKKDELQTK